MKTNLVFILSIFFFFSCKKNDQVAVEQKIDKDHPVYKYIKKLGFRDIDVKDIGNEFLVDGDILFEKNSNPDFSIFGGPQTEQYGTGSYVAYNTQPNIVVAVDPSASAFINEIADAIAMWNNIPNCRLKFTLSPTPSVNQNILIYDDPNLHSYTCASASFPMNGRPGYQIRVRMGTMSGMSSTQIRGTIAHELGHCIGFRHSNWREGTEVATGTLDYAYFTATHVMGTPIFEDPASIMQGGSCGISPANLSNFDITAMQFLYPANPPVPGTVPVFRYYSQSSTKDHFYTTNINELANAGSYDYTFEGVGFFAFPNQVAGSVPVYRYHQASTGDHLYTTNFNELGFGNFGFSYEGIRFYAYPTALNGSLPVFRYYNSTAGDHFYTKNQNEFVSGTGGWSQEGTAFFAF